MSNATPNQTAMPRVINRVRRCLMVIDGEALPVRVNEDDGSISIDDCIIVPRRLWSKFLASKLSKDALVSPEACPDYPPPPDAPQNPTIMQECYFIYEYALDRHATWARKIGADGRWVTDPGAVQEHEWEPPT